MEAIDMNDSYTPLLKLNDFCMDFINTKMHNCEIICNNEVALLINLQFLQYPKDTERVLFLITHVLQYIIYFNLAPNFCVGSDCH